jgi:hypothetical protein
MRAVLLFFVATWVALWALIGWTAFQTAHVVTAARCLCE